MKFAPRIMATILLILGVVPFSGCGSSGGAASEPVTSSWSFVDGNGANGINKNPSQSAYAPQLTALGSKLYAAWDESSNLHSQVRVAVYNGNDNAPSWNFVDGGGANGINKNTARNAYELQLTAFGSKLYATWHEDNGSSTYQIRVAVYNGDDSAPSWSFVDGNGTNGINQNTANSASSPQLTVLGSKLYATWNESVSGHSQIRVAVYNGNDSAPSWSIVDGNGINGINKNPAQTALFPQLTALGSKLYATWNEVSGTINQIRVAVYNGNDSAPSWSFVDGNGANGINKVATQNASAPQLTTLGSKLYATWYENSGTTNQIRVAVYNGNDSAPSWSFVDGNGANGINKNPSQNALAPQLTTLGSTLYAAWYEFSGTSYQVRVAIFNGNDSAPSWRFVDGNGVNGINKNPTNSAHYSPHLTALGLKLYAIWYEFNGTANQIRVAVGQ